MSSGLVSRDRAARSAAIGLPLIALLMATGTTSSTAQDAPPAASTTEACANDNGGIALPPGFCATIFADNIGHARHLVVAPDGVVYVNTWSGNYYHDDTPPAGGFLVALQDSATVRRAAPPVARASRSSMAGCSPR
jgi:hypothetical protein